MEKIGDQLQSYDTATIPLTIKGRTTNVLMAIAPVHHIPYAVVLGRNVPGLKFSWSVDGEEITLSTSKADNTSNLRGKGQESGGAGERASQVVQESAGIPAPGPRRPLGEEDSNQGKHGVQQDPKQEKKTVTKTVTFKEKERQSRQEERVLLHSYRRRLRKSLSP